MTSFGRKPRRLDSATTGQGPDAPTTKYAHNALGQRVFKTEPLFSSAATPGTGKNLNIDWVFAGSGFWKDEETGKQHYQANGGDFICVSNFPTATLDLPVHTRPLQPRGPPASV